MAENTDRVMLSLLIPRKLKERARKVIEQHGDLTEMVIAGLEDQVLLRERRQQTTEPTEAKAS
jgi:hypothetical protein